MSPPVVRRSFRSIECVLALGLALSLLACSRHPAAPPTDETPDQVLFGVRHSVVADGRIRGRIEADSAFLFLQNRTARLHGVRSEILSPTQEQVASLSADEGVLHIAEPLLVARGEASVSVVGVARRLESDEVEIDFENGTITAPGTATVVEGGSSREVERFRGDLRLIPLPDR